MPSAPTQPAVEGLEPAALWQHFSALSNIPRPSKQEQRVCEWLKAFASERNLECRQDSVGNIVIRRPGSAGGEAAPTLVIQGHVDMVCEKNAVTTHDFTKDPIRLRRDGEWLRADGTTLGADNGIGVAAALALLDMPPSQKLPPLECLFTVDEETGLTGAYQIAPDLVTGRVMLNLDTEEYGEICIGCAGGGDSTVVLEVETEAAPAGASAHTVHIKGLLGGHSGLNIHEDRGNAVQLAARVAQAVLAAAPGSRLAAIRGGDKRNAIAREASFDLLVPPSSQAAAAEAVASVAADLRAEYGQLEKGLAVTMQEATQAGRCITVDGARRLATLLLALPHGALKRSHVIEGLVETSNNVASVQPTDAPSSSSSSSSTIQAYTIVMSTRSSLGPALEAVRDRLEGIAGMCGARITRGKAYPGWAPNPASPVLQITKRVYAGLLGREPHVAAIHAGLECGILGEKFPGMDMVSFGPTIRGAHSPDERVLVDTVPAFWKVVLGVVSELADTRA